MKAATGASGVFAKGAAVPNAAIEIRTTPVARRRSGRWAIAVARRVVRSIIFVWGPPRSLVRVRTDIRFAKMPALLSDIRAITEDIAKHVRGGLLDGWAGRRRWGQNRSRLEQAVEIMSSGVAACAPSRVGRHASVSVRSVASPNRESALQFAIFRIEI